ncbi:aminoglycoside phosphotransferase family protein [Ruminococcus sp.]|uniref:phosphotransferase enzyme family protein n=1 Tax=Ruminococcus sp. TaxID=41978 RepID=UPI001B4575D2|nr:aminoglycoside phosphotransferase family protein [Ruminococcus sp.]MBP5432610.1 aminoglycoside phosphotransferase family protein [Ruminococcus sp.]
MDISYIPTLFGLPEANSLTELPAGHINRTVLAVCGNKKYIMQSLNSSVFRSPEAVMHNISRIESALENVPDIAVPHFIAAGDKNYAIVEGRIWRIYSYITANSNAVANASAAGRAFGTFIRVMDGQELGKTPAIEGFHDFDCYFSELAALNRTDRSSLAALDRLRDTLGQVFTSSLKKRVIHGDAKPDNIIISDTPTIIDLDTAMYGYAAMDFGDLVRSVCRGEIIDTAAVSNITKGFSQGIDGLLGADEVRSLYFGILWLTGELAMRYLADSRREVKYFRGKSSADCLARAEELLRQLDMFTSHGNEIKEIVYSNMEKAD